MSHPQPMNLMTFHQKTLEQPGKDDHPSDSVFDDSKLKKFISSRLSPTTSFVIPEIKPQQVADISTKILVNKATGHDGLSAKILKLNAPSFYPPTLQATELINCNQYLP